MMYTQQESFPVNGTNSMEEFPAMISSATSSSPPSASIQFSDENLSPSASVSFAQMLKQQAPPVLKPTTINKPIQTKSSTIEISTKNKKNKKKKDNDSDEEHLNEDEQYYSSVPNFHSSFSLEEVFDRLKLGLYFMIFIIQKKDLFSCVCLVNGEEHPVASTGETPSKVTTKKKNKKTKQVLFATGLGGQAKL
jgi:hypothetical protein